MPSLNNLISDLNKYDNNDIKINEPLKEYFAKLKEQQDSEWSKYKTFWPPRLLNAYINDKLSCFFGAGLSIPCGLPSWDSLLRDSLGINKEVFEDDNAKNDPLTQAEVASHKFGSEKVQDIIRESVKKTNKPSYNHYLLAAMNLKYYITSNYDCLFEAAWKQLHGENTLVTILNDSDIYMNFNEGNIDKPKNTNAHYLFKIHGCVNRTNEQMILTRSDYRHHYRSNNVFFSIVVKEIFASYHILFLGFSHRDPEITRLVEDSIWCWEQAPNERLQPNFYSLQFDMSSITPEIFAARGIVALSPPVVLPKDDIDIRSYFLAHALADLHAMVNYVDIDTVSLDKDIDDYFKSINNEILKAIGILKKYESNAIESLKGMSSAAWLTDLMNELSNFAGQGVYLLNSEGKILHYSISDELLPTRKERIEKLKAFDDRPYFQRARTFRTPFISDLYESIFNKIATFSICLPIIVDNVFVGLLFSACQIGQWMNPYNEAQEILKKKRSVILIDSNGICLFPPNNEFGFNRDNINGEDRIGFIYDDLFVLSRRDKLIARVMENLIPLGIDDDVLSLSGDMKYYSLVKEFDISRWKLTVSSRIILAKK